MYNQPENRIEVWLAGQNKAIQKKYWEFFKNNGWNTYHIPFSVETGFSIVDKVLVDHPDFTHPETLTKQIEEGVMTFIREMNKVLD